jgi:hypothetical protein
MITLDSTVVAAKEQVASDLGGETAILNLKNGVYYGLDEVGSRIWELIQEPIRVSQVQAALLAEYEVEAGQCEQDLLALLEKLAAETLVDVSNGTHP